MSEISRIGAEPSSAALLERLEVLGEGNRGVLSSIEALEWMRLRVLERLVFQYNDLRDTWLSRESTVEEEKAYIQGRMDSVNRGIDEMIAALIEGRVSTASEAFAQFEDYTSLKQLDNFLKHEAPFYLAPIQWGYKRRIEAGETQKPQNGQGFRNLLQANDVDVDGWIRFSEIKSPREREAWLLGHVKHLRDEPYSSGRGYPAQTIAAILEQLIESENPKVKRDAQVLYGNVSGETALTGFSDAAWAVQSREGAKSAATMAAAMLVAGPLGAWVEGHAALGTVTLAGRSLWQGSRAGEVGFFAKSLGFGTEATAFWAGNDVLQASFVGGAEYFTGHGLASSFLMLGGLRAFGAAYAIGCGHALARAADEASLYFLKLGYLLLNRTGQVMTEWGGFWGLGQLEELIGLVPAQDTTLRQELAQAGLSLLQLKAAVLAGKAVTGDFATVKTLEIKLDTAERLLEKARERGEMGLEAADVAFAQLFPMSQPAYATGPVGREEGSRYLAVPVVLSTERRATNESSGIRPQDPPSYRTINDLQDWMETQLERIPSDRRGKIYTMTSFSSFLSRLQPGNLSEGFQFGISADPTGETVNSIGFRSSDAKRPKGRRYLHIDFRVVGGRFVLIGLNGSHRPIALAALRENPAVDLRGFKGEGDLVILEERFFVEQRRVFQGWPVLSIAGFKARLTELHAEGLPDDSQFGISASPVGEKVTSISFRGSGTERPKGRGYLHIDFRVVGGRLVLTGCDGVNRPIALEALRKNPAVDLRGFKGEGDLVMLEERFFVEQKRVSQGWPVLSIAGFKARLTELHAEGLPDDFQFGMSVVPVGGMVTNIGFRSSDAERAKGQYYLHIDFKVVGGRFVLIGLDGLNRSIALAALRENPAVDLGGFKGEADLMMLEERFFLGIEKIINGWPELEIADFQRRLKGLTAEGLPEGFCFGLSGVVSGQRAYSISFRKSTEERPKGSAYLHIKLEVLAGGKLLVEAVDGTRKGEFYHVLKQNPNVRFSPFLWVEYAEPGHEQRLLLRLSEYGRQALLNQFQALGAEVSEIGVRLAARGLLLDYAKDYARDPRWDPRDPRWAVALELNRYLATERFSREDAAALSTFTQAAREREIDRQLGDYDRIHRLVGSAPISESGWDLVFSPELREGLRAFAAEYSAALTSDPSRELLRDPYNEILGAYYWRLLETDHAAERWEIVSHLYAQRRRRDSLKEFYDGMMKASGRSEEAVHLRIQNELRLLEQSRSAWEMDQEAPFRLTEPGIIGGAARFLWTEVYGPHLRDGLISGARELFPRHRDEFAPGIDLSERLPQALFFEVIGHEAAKCLKAWNAGIDTTYARGIDVLELMLGLGDESVMGFRAGFGEETLRKPLADLCQGLMRMDEAQFREYLESSVIYSRNVVNEQGHYERKTVSMRRGEVLENLLRGYGLREMTGTVRSFRFLGSGDAATELARASEIYEKLTGDIPESPSDAERRWLFALLDFYTSDSHPERERSLAEKGDRWYEFEQWLLEDLERERILLGEIR